MTYCAIPENTFEVYIILYILCPQVHLAVLMSKRPKFNHQTTSVRVCACSLPVWLFCDCTDFSTENLNYNAQTMPAPQALEFKWTSRKYTKNGCSAIRSSVCVENRV